MVRGPVYNYKIVNRPFQQISRSGKEMKIKLVGVNETDNASLITGVIWPCPHTKERRDWRVKNG